MWFGIVSYIVNLNLSSRWILNDSLGYLMWTKLTTLNSENHVNSVKQIQAPVIQIQAPVINKNSAEQPEGIIKANVYHVMCTTAWSLTLDMLLVTLPQQSLFLLSLNLVFVLFHKSIFSSSVQKISILIRRFVDWTYNCTHICARTYLYMCTRLMNKLSTS